MGDCEYLKETRRAGQTSIPTKIFQNLVSKSLILYKCVCLCTVLWNSLWNIVEHCGTISHGGSTTTVCRDFLIDAFNLRFAYRPILIQTLFMRQAS